MAQFTPGELEVMRILWEHGELKPAEIQRRFSRRIKNPALRSYLSILLEKGHVTRRLRGKAYYYRAKTPRRSVFRSKVRELADAFCGGSTAALLMNLIKSEKLSEDELIELKRLAEEPADAPASTRTTGDER